MATTRRLLVFAAAAGAALSFPPPAAADHGLQADANVLLGGRSLNHADWAPTERMGQLGVLTTFLPPDWPVALAGDLLLAGDEGAAPAPGGLGEQRGRTTELDLGVRKIWRPGGGSFRPYLGGGLAFITGRLERAGPAGTVSDEDDGAGLWVGGGLGWVLGKAVNVGVDARLSRARARLFGDNKNSGGASLGVFVGYRWGGGEHVAALPPPSVPAAPTTPVTPSGPTTP